MRSTLTPLQLTLLRTIEGLDAVHLTGGAALGHCYFGHRGSFDLDFFTPDAERIDEVAARLSALCRDEGFSLSEEQRYPGFVRFRVRSGDEDTIVDIAHDPVPQSVPIESKPLRDGIRVDALDDIIANKLGALLGRGETKDLVDLYFASRQGIDVLQYMPAAAERDGGLEPATLAFVLDSVSVDTSALLMVAVIDPSDLDRFRRELIERLQRMAWPE
ncbi:MAG: nucleotidyl transferase AbiEii/AbiGii toxin family protein [Myxococcales bacterium]|nr:nucleotidyl transferase AbiEii/AbiGii toxin family protein [Myxococcales bacterium]